MLEVKSNLDKISGGHTNFSYESEYYEIILEDEPIEEPVCIEQWLWEGDYMTVIVIFAV